MAERTDGERQWLQTSRDDRIEFYQTYALGALVDPAGMNQDQIGLLTYGLFYDPEVDRADILPDFNGDISSFAGRIPDHPGNTVTATIASASGGVQSRFLDNALFVGALTHALYFAAAPAAGSAAYAWAATQGKAAAAAAGMGAKWAAGILGRMAASDMAIVRAVPKLAKAVRDTAFVAGSVAAINEFILGADQRADIDQAAQDTNPMRDKDGKTIQTETGSTVTVRDGLTLPESIDRLNLSGAGSQPGALGGTVLDPNPPGPPIEEDFYGVPPGFRARVARPNVNLQPWGGNQPSTIYEEVMPVFGGKDAWDAVSQLYASGQLEAFQSMMVQAGLLDEGKYLPGVSDGETINAMISVMGAANNMGLDDWRPAAEQVLKSGMQNLEETRAQLAPIFVRRTYEKPDYDTLSQGVKGLFRDRLGRDPLDYEVSLFADQLAKDYRSQFDVQEDARYQEFAAGNKDWQAETWEPQGSMFGDIPVAPDGFTGIEDDPEWTPNAEGVRVAGGGTVQGVDPAASFAEEFERRYGQTLANQEAKQQSQMAQQRAMSMFSSVRSRMRNL